MAHLGYDFCKNKIKRTPLNSILKFHIQNKDQSPKLKWIDERTS